MHVAPRCLVAAVAVLVLASCTSLTSYSDRQPEHKTQALEGVRYSLPMRQYDIEITRSLEKCESKKDGKDIADVELSMSAKVTARDVAGESFLLNYTDLSGWTKTTSIAIETYDTGVIKSLNASADDKSAEIVSATVKTGFGLASIAGGFPISAAQVLAQPKNQQTAYALKPSQVLVCTDAGKTALGKISEHKSQLKADTDKLEKLTDAITQLTARQPVYGLTRKEKDKLSSLLDQQHDVIAALATTQDNLRKAQDKVRHTRVEYWPGKVGESSADFPIDQQALRKLGALLTVESRLIVGKDVPNDCGKELTTPEWCLQQKLAASAKLFPLLASADTVKDDQIIDSKEPKGQQGIYIRPPAPGILLICKSQEMACMENSTDYLYRSSAELVPQLGHLQFLPFKNEAFRNNVIALVLRPNGTVEKLEYKTLKAAGEVAANLGADLVGQWAGFAQARDKAEKDEAAARNKAELDALDQQINLLTKQQQLDALQAPKNDELTSLQADTTMIEARTKLLEAQAAELRAKEALAKAENATP